MPQPNMRSILAQSCRNFSSPASKVPKKGSKVATIVARTVGCVIGVYIGFRLTLKGGG